MKVIRLASNSSVWRGLDYYNEKKIIQYKKIDEHLYEGTSKGSEDNQYHIFLDIAHPKKSKCDCPHAKDRMIICKHIIALYFTIFPDKVDTFLKEVEEAQQDYEEYEQELHSKVLDKVHKMSKSDLQEALVDILEIAPDWIYDGFIRNYIDF